MIERPDVLIVGAGMAGLTLAVALAEQELNVIIIDPSSPVEPSEWSQGFDHRVSAITPASEFILQRLGVWDDMTHHRVSEFFDMSVWDRDGTGDIQFNCFEAGMAHLGHIVENRVTTHCLFQKVLAASNIEYKQVGLDRILESESPDDIMDDNHQQVQWNVVLTDGSKWQPLLLVGADGAQSRVRDQLGFRCRTWSYGQSALVTTVKTEKEHGNVARQVFLETGPLAFLPLRTFSEEDKGHYSSIVWSLNHDEVQSTLSLGDKDFCEQLGRAFEHKLGQVIETDERFAFPLVQNHAVHYILPGVSLIGDAAHTIHPLAGQGINLGFLDAATLAEEILSAINNGLSCAEFSILRRYQRRRKPQNLTMMSIMEGFNRLFQLDLPPLRVARNLGMSFLDQHFLIKNRIISQAMGLEGDLPELAKPGLAADF